ncbi:MAG: hemolysin family protein [Armatimonadota bacterium]|nr:hemolysin family protein [Armatimonadota bacterium]MCX7777753.1 hemolysin family protein [Armatimonadota bacterium]MDW8026193.1 hemolysin family protein [Armatimonadota bacterium]
MGTALLWIEAFLIGGSLVAIFLLSLFEAALVASSRAKLQAMLSHSADRAQKLLDDWTRARRYIPSFVVGCNIAILFVSALTTHLLTILAPKKNHIHAIGTLLMLAFILSVCEITPKAYSMQYPERVLNRWHKLLRFFGEVLTPISTLFATAAQAFLRLMGYKGVYEQLKLTDEEIMVLLEMGVEEDVLRKQEFDIASGVVRLDKTLVKEIMVPRPDIVALPSSCKLDEVVKLITETGHSRIPLYEGSIDNIVGVVYAYEILSHWSRGNFDIEPRLMMRTPLYVPETKNLRELLNEMRASRVHIAIVIDEYGSTAGLVTLEDIAEQVVGELVDEHDAEAVPIQRLSDGSYLVDARLNKNEVKDKLAISLPDGEYDTLGGFVLYALGRIPKVGESIQIDAATVIVEEVKKHRVTKVRIVMRSEEQQSSSDDC